MKKKAASFGLLVLLMLAVLVMPAQAAWKTTTKGKMYTANNAKGYLTGWQTIDGARYYFNSKGIMVTGWKTISKKGYYFGKDGKMRTGWQTIGKYTYYFGTDGARHLGWSNIKDAKGNTYRYYFMLKRGRMYKGFNTIDGKKYYFTNEGKLCYGFMKIGGKTYYADTKTGELAQSEWVNNTYYFKDDYTMAVSCWVGGKWVGADGRFTGTINYRGFVTDKGVTKYYNVSGQVVKGFINVSGKRYYMRTSDGAMVTGTFKLGNATYFADKNGVLYVNKWSGKKYYTSSGAMAVGWTTISGKKYYFNNSGNYVTGWQKIGDKTYYFDTKGVLQTSKLVKSNKKYYFVGSDGSKQYGVVKVGNYYNFFSVKTDGRRLLGWIVNSGKRYYANKKNARLYKSQFFTVGKNKYYAKGDCSLAMGLNLIGGKYYYFTTTKGRMVKNAKQTVNGATYYFDSTGAAAVKKWVEIGGKYYYFKADGKMAVSTTVDGYPIDSAGVRGIKADAKKGWATENGKKVYYVDGNKVTGWYTISGSKYYFDSNGIMQTGLIEVGGKKYYLYPTGIMAYGTTVAVGAKEYTINNSGVVTKEETITISGNSLGSKIAKEAIKYVGNKYVYGGTSLTNGADCSGFVYTLYGNAGIRLLRVANDQMYGPNSYYVSLGYKKPVQVSIDTNSMLPGDLVFYGSSGYASHVAMYIGNGKIVHASNSQPYPAGGIKISNYNYQTPIAVRRYWS